MKEYYANVGGNNLLMCKDSDEAVVFDDFGNFIKKISYREGLMQCGTGYVSECNLCSVSGKSSTDLEVYYNGYRKKISGLHSITIKKIENECWGYLMNHLPFRLKGVDDIPITIIIFKKDFSLSDFARKNGFDYPNGWFEVD